MGRLGYEGEGSAGNPIIRESTKGGMGGRKSLGSSINGTH